MFCRKMCTIYTILKKSDESPDIFSYIWLSHLSLFLALSIAYLAYTMRYNDTNNHV